MSKKTSEPIAYQRAEEQIILKTARLLKGSRPDRPEKRLSDKDGDVPAHKDRGVRVRGRTIQEPGPHGRQRTTAVYDVCVVGWLDGLPASHPATASTVHGGTNADDRHEWVYHTAATEGIADRIAFGASALLEENYKAGLKPADCLDRLIATDPQDFLKPPRVKGRSMSAEDILAHD